MNEFVDTILTKHLPTTLSGDAVAVPDNEEEMNWRIFFAHSQDMQGFRADIFTGGPNEARHPKDPSFQPLRERWKGDSRSLIRDLAAFWNIPENEAALRRHSNPFRPREEKALGIQPVMEMLLASDREGVHIFGETMRDLRGDRIGRKTNSCIRAYMQNSALLARHDANFRQYLQDIAPGGDLPPTDVEVWEKEAVRRIERDFYNVGPALANYMVCDWLLWLWREGRIDWFTSHKADSVHLAAVTQGKLPPEAAEDFVGYCRGLRVPAGFGSVSGKPLPPRILNEGLWLELNRSSGMSNAVN